MYFNGKNEMLSESSKEFIEKLMEKHETSSRSTPVLYHESMKYIQFFPNQRREGEVITVGLVNKQPVKDSDEHMKSQTEASKNQNADELVDCVGEVGVIGFHRVNEGDRLTCVHDIQMPDPFSIKREDGYGKEFKTILHEGQQGFGFFIYSDLPIENQSRNLKLTILDLSKNPAEARQSQDVRIKPNSLLDKVIAQYEKSSIDVKKNWIS